MLKTFPKALFKGDSVSIVFNLKDRETKEKHTFQVGDIIQIGIKGSLEDTDYQVHKDFTVLEEGTDLNVYFTPEETDAMTQLEQKAILEVRYIYNNGVSRATVYQEKINLEGVVIDE